MTFLLDDLLALNPAAGKAGIPRLFGIEHHCPGLSEPERSAKGNPNERFQIRLS